MTRRGNLVLADFSNPTPLTTGERLRRMVNGEEIEEIQMPEGHLRRITPEIAEQIKERVNQAAIDAAAEFGIEVSLVLQRLDESDERLEQDITVRFSAKDPIGHDRLTKALLRRGHKYKIPAGLFGHSFIRKNSEHIITGIDDTDKKQIVMRLKTPHGNIRADAKAVVKFLRTTGQWLDEGVW